MRATENMRTHIQRIFGYYCFQTVVIKLGEDEFENSSIPTSATMEKHMFVTFFLMYMMIRKRLNKLYRPGSNITFLLPTLASMILVYLIEKRVPIMKMTIRWLTSGDVSIATSHSEMNCNPIADVNLAGEHHH